MKIINKTIKKSARLLFYLFKIIFEIIFPENDKYLSLKQVNYDDFIKNSKINIFNECPDCFYLFDYENKTIKDMIWFLKFYKKDEFSSFLGRAIGEKLDSIILNNYKDVSGDDFILIPVPIHKQRREERGYNQCELICEEIVQNLNNIVPNCNKKEIRSFNIFYDPNILIRNKYTKKQSWSDAVDRQKNLKDVFRIPADKIDNVSNKKIILIDDVITTGSTIREARRTLLESGASLVISITIAH